MDIEPQGRRLRCHAPRGLGPEPCASRTCGSAMAALASPERGDAGSPARRDRRPGRPVRRRQDHTFEPCPPLLRRRQRPGDIDGRDVLAERSPRSATRSPWSQEPFLFDDTVRANIAYAKPDATTGEIETAARAAAALDFIVTLDRAMRPGSARPARAFPGGQRSAVAHRPRLSRRTPRSSLLDEATSALDTESEALVQAALERLMARRMTIIAHRLSTVKSATTASTSSPTAGWSRPALMPAWPARAASMRGWPRRRTWAGLRPGRREFEAFLPAGPRPVGLAFLLTLRPVRAGGHPLAFRSERPGGERDGPSPKAACCSSGMAASRSPSLPGADRRRRFSADDLAVAGWRIHLQDGGLAGLSAHPRLTTARRSGPSQQGQRRRLHGGSGADRRRRRRHHHPGWAEGAGPDHAGRADRTGGRADTRVYLAGIAARPVITLKNWDRTRLPCPFRAASPSLEGPLRAPTMPTRSRWKLCAPTGRPG